MIMKVFRGTRDAAASFYTHSHISLYLTIALFEFLEPASTNHCPGVSQDRLGITGLRGGYTPQVTVPKDRLLAQAFPQVRIL